MKEEYISKRKWSKTFPSSARKPQNRPRYHLTSISRRRPRSNDHEQINDERSNVHGSPSILNHDGYPEQIPQPLKKSTEIEEVGYLRDPDSDIGGRAPAIGLSYFDHGDRWAGGHEVAHDHCRTYEQRDCDFVFVVPSHGSIPQIHDLRSMLTISEDRLDLGTVLV
jgi:hypothetical protein